MPRPKDIDTTEGRERHEAKHHRILDAALHVFALKGYHEAKISEIARLAGVADGTIYLYFKNKDDLLLSLLTHTLQRLNEGLKEDLSTIPDVKDKLRHVIDYHVKTAIESPALAAFVSSELRRNISNLNEQAKEQLIGYLTQWTQVIDEGKRQGSFRLDLNTEVLQQLLFGALEYACESWVRREDRDAADLEQFGEHLQRLMLSAVVVPATSTLEEKILTPINQA